MIYDRYRWHTHPRRIADFEPSRLEGEVLPLLGMLESVLDRLRRKVIQKEKDRLEMAIKITNHKDKRWKEDYKKRRRVASQFDTDEYYVRYRYVPVRNSPRSRRFCKWMEEFTARNKVFRKEDIIRMAVRGVNREHGHKGNNYSIFKYKGGVNCHHYWQRVIIHKSMREAAILGTRADAITPDTNPDKSIVETRPIDMPNRGHHPAYTGPNRSGIPRAPSSFISAGAMAEKINQGILSGEIEYDPKNLTAEDEEWLATLDDGQTAMRNQLIKARSVAKWAKANGVELTAEDLKRLGADLDNPMAEGGTAFVFDLGTGKVMKLQSLVAQDPEAEDNAVEKQLHDISIGNKLFPNNKLVVKGIHENEANAFLVTEQKLVKGQHPTLKQAVDHLESLPNTENVDFSRNQLGGQAVFTIKDDNGNTFKVHVYDLTQRNMIVDENGDIQIIDYKIGKIEGSGTPFFRFSSTIKEKE